MVDAQLKKDSIYVFGNENKKYTDVDFELYGLSIKGMNAGYESIATGKVVKL